MATEPHEERRRTRRVVLVAAVAAALLIVVTAGALAAKRWAPVSQTTQAQLKRAIVGFELAKASARPQRMIGKKLTPEDKTALQARFVRRLERFSSGPALAQWRTWDYAQALLEDEWDARELVGTTGRVVYWDVRHRDADGALVVRAGVEKRYKVVTWDARARRAAPQKDWVTGVLVDEYALKQVDGAWKVVSTDHWRFWDSATGQLTTGP
jgi:hypothetical protein